MSESLEEIHNKIFEDGVENGKLQSKETIDMLIEGQKNLEIEKQELADSIVELVENHKQEIEKIKLDFQEKVKLLLQRIPRFSRLIISILLEEEKNEG